MRRISLYLLLLAYGTIFFSGAAFAAGSVQISPVHLDLSAKRPIASLRIKNIGDAKIAFQLNIKRWQLQHNKEIYQQSDALIFSPPIFTLQPGQIQIIRVGLRSEKSINATTELAYRLFFRQLPLDNNSSDLSSLRLIFNISLPVFVKPKQKLQKLLSWKLAYMNRTHLSLRVTNSGNAYALIYGIKLDTIHHKTIYSQEQSFYLLPQQQKVFKFTNSQKFNCLYLSGSSRWGDIKHKVCITR